MVLLIVGIIVLNVGAYFLLRKIENIALLGPSIWDDALIKATRKPLTLILWVTSATFAIQIVHLHLDTTVYDFMTPTRSTLAGQLLRRPDHLSGPPIHSGRMDPFTRS